MQEYYFLFALALVWTLFATIQDIKSREVANWLNFSLIAFALAYRAFYATINQDYHFFLLGLAAFAIFFALAYVFYYIKAFAGGDAKLLMGLGIILPYKDYFDLATLSLIFLFLLFLVGAVYSIIYSALIIAKNRNKFSKELRKKTKHNKKILIISLALLAISIALSFINSLFMLLLILSLIPLVYLYTASLDKCMLILLPPSKLTEGDWLEKPVRINSRITIKKTVHGLSLKDIQLLKKHNKKVLIKQGIPFVPAFMVALIIMVLFFLTSKLPLQELLLTFF